MLLKNLKAKSIYMFRHNLVIPLVCYFSYYLTLKQCSKHNMLLQVVAGELELKECNLNWSPEDFESKLQVRPSNKPFLGIIATNLGLLTLGCLECPHCGEIPRLRVLIAGV